MSSNPAHKEIAYDAGEYLLREGAKCDALIIVKEGQIEIFKSGPNKAKIPIGIVQSGEYLGEMSLIANRPHSANAVALTRTVCIKITHTALEEQLAKVPSWLVALTRGLVHKLDKTNDVLRRNGIVDETLTTSVQAIENHQDVKKEDKAA